MKRTALLRRTPLRSKPPAWAKPREAEVERQLPRLTRIGVAARVTDVVAAAPKADYVRSPKLREAYRALPCQWPGCGLEDGTIVCAHSNWGCHGKGKSIKASDDRGASLCFKHHADLDQGSKLSEAERKAGWWAAHVSSVRQLVARGLWPKHIPVPSMEAGLP